MNTQALETKVLDAAFDGMSDADIKTALLTADIANPVECPMLPRRLTKMEALSLLSPESMEKVLTYQNLALVYASFDAQDHASCLSWVQALYIVGAIAPEEVAAVSAYIQETYADPTWEELVSWAALNNCGGLEEIDIAKAKLAPERAAFGPVLAYAQGVWGSLANGEPRALPDWEVPA